METAEFGSAWTDGAKRAVQLYVESGEKMGRMMLELHERSTSWAKETMLAPLFEAQRSKGLKAYLELRDGPFQPEPMGPRSKPRAANTRE